MRLDSKLVAITIICASFAVSGCLGAADVARGAEPALSAQSGGAAPPNLGGLGSQSFPVIGRVAGQSCVWQPAPAGLQIRHVAGCGTTAGTGTRANPWASLRQALDQLKPGEVAYVHEGTYSQTGPATTATDGSQSAPIRVIAAPQPNGGADAVTIRRAEQNTGTFARPLLQLTRRYWTVERLAVDATTARNPSAPKLDTERPAITVEGGNIVLRRIRVRGGPAQQAVRFFNATDAAIIDSTIGGNGPGTWPDRSDWHGIQVVGASNRVLIQGLISSNNHGDSVQCNSEYTPAAQTPRNMTVSGGVLRDDHENAVDIKRCDGVTVQGVRMIGYRPAPGHGDRHAAIVVHFGAGGLLLHGNRISESSVGIRIGPGRQNGNVHEVGAAVIRRNTIFESCPTTVPPSMSPAVCRGAGIDAAADQLDVYHNTIARLRGQTGTGRGAGIRIGAGADNATTYQRALVVNNLIQDLAPGKRTAVVTAQLPPNRLNAGRNLYLQAPAPAAPWPTQNDVVSMAAILQAPTFLPTTTSPAYNGARVLAAAQQAPVCFGAPDIGATERCP